MYLFAGVLTRCLVSLEEKDIDGSKSTETSDALREVCLPCCMFRNKHTEDSYSYSSRATFLT